MIKNKEGNVLFKHALNSFYLWIYGNVLFNDTLNTFLIYGYTVSDYGYMMSDIW